MIGEMATVRITEAELVRDIHAVLAQVQEGVEVIVEQRHRPVAVIKTPQGPGRKIAECIALAKAYEEKLGCAPAPDADFAKDVQAAIDAHREPFDPPAWGRTEDSAELRRSREPGPFSSFSLPVGVVPTDRSPAFRAGEPRSYASGTSSLALETRRARRHPREGSPTA
jgi:antitoxin (DNA-binding transcriptional repressor) of toxin-antitoxin stability system